MVFFGFVAGFCSNAPTAGVRSASNAPGGGLALAIDDEPLLMVDGSSSHTAFDLLRAVARQVDQQ
jgi:hypothetical protein